MHTEIPLMIVQVGTYESASDGDEASQFDRIDTIVRLLHNLSFTAEYEKN